MEEIFGFVERVIYTSESFTVAKLKEPRKAELTCIVGPLATLQPGETVHCKGVWIHHAQYGRQFKVGEFESRQPSDLLGIQKYLESGMVKGIGATYAERIVEKFGTDTLKIIDETPTRLLEVAGIGKKRAETITRCWLDQKEVRNVMIFLRGSGVSPAYAQKIYKTYGDQSIEKVKSDPFALAREIRGIGFKIADGIAQKLGIPLHSPARIEAGIEHVLWELSNEGHTCYPEKELLEKGKEMLAVEISSIEETITSLVKEEKLFREGEFIWLKAFYFERGIVRELERLTATPSQLRTIDVEKALEWVQKQLSLELAEEQKKAVSEAVQQKVHIITGGPGTGKSTITRAILAITEKLTEHIFLVAPTGRAAKRMTEITGKKGSTIHALLEMDFQLGGFKKNRTNPLLCDLIIIDEASMIDTLLMYHLLKAIPSTSRVILIGDVDQLPSVGPGTILQDLINSEKLGMTRLTQIFRQAANSRIVTNAHLINRGEFPDLSFRPKTDFLFLEKDTPEEILSTILELVAEKIPQRHRFHRLHEIQVLAPMKRGIIGIENLNVALQQRLNPSPNPLCRMGRAFHVGDKVMQIRNNYQKLIFNGDIGKILAIDSAEQALSISFEDRVLTYEFSQIDELMLAYAVSIHKYQGSECPCIIIPVHMTHFKMLHRNLLYTGLTRGKKLVIFVGTKKAVAVAIFNNDVRRRHTGLKRALLA